VPEKLSNSRFLWAGKTPRFLQIAASIGGNATVSLQTKKINGLHENDFIMATKIDRIFARTSAA
jgi:hypothetical protein